MRQSGFSAGTLLLIAIWAAGAAGAAGAPERSLGLASETGAWASRRWPVVGIHAMVLPTGEILHYSYAKAEGPQGDRHYYGGSVGKVWDPQRDSFRDVSMMDNIFCSGHSFLADGSVYVTGGLTPDGDCATAGRSQTFIFNPFTLTWHEDEEMSRARYYPTNLTLGDGSVLILTGHNARCNPEARMEMFLPGDGIRTVAGGSKQLKLYPRVHLLPSGEMAHVGPEPAAWIFDPQARQWRRIGPTLHGEARLQGTSFLVPGHPFRVMICGGYQESGENPTESCEVIDFSDGKPRWSGTSPMHFPRAHADAVLLPDGKVLLVGGGSHSFYGGPIVHSELYDPETDRWTLAARQRFGRMYHSTAVLMPDGRVLSAGQDDDETGATGSGAWAEIYRPPYLYDGKRPRISRAPESVEYGKSFTLKVRQGPRIESIVLIRPSAVTHSVNSTQRFLALGFSRLGGRKIRVRAPRNPNLAPPGYYMLFALNERGVPSKARMLHLAP